MGNTKANLTEEQVTEITLSSLKENPEGVTEYPILEFDDRALRLLSSGVAETLRYSEVKPRGGLGYRFVKRLFDIVVSSLGLILLAIPMGVVALVIYLDDKGSPIFSQARLTENGKVFRYEHIKLNLAIYQVFSAISRRKGVRKSGGLMRLICHIRQRKSVLFQAFFR